MANRGQQVHARKSEVCHIKLLKGRLSTRLKDTHANRVVEEDGAEAAEVDRLSAAPHLQRVALVEHCR